MGDEARVLGFLASLADVETLQEFSDQSLRGLADLVPADLWGFNDLDPGSRQMHAAIWPPDGATPEHFAAVARVVWEHPVLGSFRESGDGACRRLSDLWSRDRYHASSLYRDAYRGMQVEYQVAFSLADGAVAATIGYAANRHDRDFDDAEVALLNALRAPLRMAWQLVHARRAVHASVTAGPADRTWGLLLVGPRSRARAASPKALALLAGAGFRIKVGEVVPEPLLSWLQRAGHEATLSLGRGEQQVDVLFLAGGRDADRVLQVSATADPTSRLSDREKHVVLLAGEGASNAQIARELGISDRTVHKHLQRAYVKLGVSNRAAAAAAVRG